MDSNFDSHSGGSASASAPTTSSAQDETRTRKAVLPPEYQNQSVRSASLPSPSENGTEPGPHAQTPSLPVRLWRTIKSIYYASSPAWQFLKSGALFLFGLFCWSSANLLLSYEPSWHWPYFFMAYGFLLTPYGPFTHLVLVPHLLPWLRRQSRGSWLHTLGQHLTLTSLTLFFTAVVWMGLHPPAIMQMDFRAATGTTPSTINPELVCSTPANADPLTVSCHLENTAGVGSIRVLSGGTPIVHRDEAPFSFSLNTNQLVEVVGQRQFHVVVHDEENTPVRRFTRTSSMFR